MGCRGFSVNELFNLNTSSEVEEKCFVFNALVIDFIGIQFPLQPLFTATSQHTEEVLLTYLKNFFEIMKISYG